jgi:small subunit ribosomal protein S8
MTDPIADMLTRIRNAYMVRKQTVLIPYSKIKFAIAGNLKKAKYIVDVEEVEDNFKNIKITLKYSNNKPAITNIKRISKCGQRVYVSRDEVPRVLNGLGVAVLSTSKGIILSTEAKKLGVGGEIICEIY